MLPAYCHHEIWGASAWPLLACGSSSGPRGHMQLQPSLLLQVADCAEKILSLRVAARSEHADQALARRVSCLAQLLKPIVALM